MKITIEHYKNKFTFESENDDLSIYELHEIWEKVLFSMGYQQETIRDFYNLDQM